MGRPPFPGSLTRQPPVPEDGIRAAVDLLRSGRLHRYNTAPGEIYQTAGPGCEYAAWQGARHCLALASGEQAMQIALHAAIMRPLLRAMDTSIDGWNACYDLIAGQLGACAAIRLPVRPRSEYYVGSSIQFFIDGIRGDGASAFVAALSCVGVTVKWFGAAQPAGFASTHKSWRNVAPQILPRTGALLCCLFDMRIPLTLSLGGCRLVVAHITDVARNIGARIQAWP